MGTTIKTKVNILSLISDEFNYSVAKETEKFELTKESLTEYSSAIGVDVGEASFDQTGTQILGSSTKAVLDMALLFEADDTGYYALISLDGGVTYPLQLRNNESMLLRFKSTGGYEVLKNDIYVKISNGTHTDTISYFMTYEI